VLTYDAWNWLVQVTLPNEDHVQANRYDGLGRRIRREDIDLPYDYYYNEAWQLLEERRDGDEDPLAQYVWHPYYIDALAVRYWDGNTDGTYDYFGASEGEQYYLHDANFNVTTLLDRGGDLLERYNYTPYGEVTFLNHNFSVATTQASVLGNTHFYTGRERDPETGLQLNRWRYYHAHLGRWLTRDPMGYPSGQYNQYRYASSRPISLVDPSGQEDCPAPCDIPDGCYVAFDNSRDCCGDTCGTKHVDIVCVQNCKGTQVRLGFGGDNRGDRLPKDGDCRMKRRSGGKLRAGGAKNKSCKDATLAEIADCLAKYPPPKEPFNSLTNNCQQDVSRAAVGCCLFPCWLPATILHPPIDDDGEYVELPIGIW